MADMIKKTKHIRLHGPALRALNAAIHQRDGDHCIICGKYVRPGEKFHHEPPGADKSDEIEKGVTLCFDCHAARHFGANSTLIRAQIVAYLRKLYGGKNG